MVVSPLSGQFHLPQKKQPVHEKHKKHESIQKNEMV